MLLRLKKTRDGAVLTCLRGDGSIAIQRTRHGGFFALHDLLHYAVETTLGLDRAFLGLMAAGWDFETFGDGTDPRYRDMPAQALIAEHLVAILSRRLSERAARDPELAPLWADEINAELAAELAKVVSSSLREGAGGSEDDHSSYSNVPQIPLASLTAIAARFDDLAARWSAVPLGEHLELTFPAS